MKLLYKILLATSVLIMMASEGIAQDTIFPWDCPRYLTKGRPTEGNFYWGIGAVQSRPSRISGFSFYAPGATVYGLAIPIDIVDWYCSYDQRHHPVYLGSQAEAARTDSLPVWMMLIQKSGDTIRRLDSVCWHYRSRPDIVWELPGTWHTIYPYAYEFYFDHPIQMSDTTWACARVGGDRIDGSCTGEFEYDMDYHIIVITDMEGEGTTEMTVMDGDVRFWYYPDRIDFAFVPILAPPDTDYVGCRTPRLRFMRASSGRPYFEWTAYTDEETLQYEVQYAQLGSNEWRTTYPTSSPFRIIDNFDPTKYYTARIRMQHRHGCPIHDTVYWSPWSDTILFYTGNTPPDTTNTIMPVETKPAVLFTLTPNPTTGKVTVTVAQPEPQLVLTLRDAAGHEVLRKELSTFNSQLSTTLDLRHLPAGAYFIALATPTASSTQRLVVK